MIENEMNRGLYEKEWKKIWDQDLRVSCAEFAYNDPATTAALQLISVYMYMHF